MKAIIDVLKVIGLVLVLGYDEEKLNKVNE